MSLRLGLLALLLPVSVHARVCGDFLFDNQTDLTLEALQPVTVTAPVFDCDSRAPFTEFKKIHEKWMHLMFIRKDLASFRHIHPQWQPDLNLFSLPINQPVTDPDNLDAPRALAEPGEYFAIIETQPKREYLTRFSYDTRVRGIYRPAPLLADPVDSTGASVQDFLIGTHHYRMEVRTSKLDGTGGRLIKFECTVLEQNANGDFEEIPDLEPWLMGAHLIFMSQSGILFQEKAFGHIHTHLPTPSSKLNFAQFDRFEMQNGLYKLWLQVQHRGQILTLPMTFYLNIL